MGARIKIYKFIGDYSSSFDLAARCVGTGSSGASYGVRAASQPTELTTAADHDSFPFPNT